MMSSVPSFAQTLEQHQLSLTRSTTKTLQINAGYLCNQACRHCHLSAGPNSKEIMNKTTMTQIIDFQKKCRFETVDITGGAPEMNPDISYLVENIAPLTNTTMLRSNLSALYDLADDQLLKTLKKHRVTIVSSFPSLNPDQTDAQRGNGIFEKTIQALRMLNKHGYGQTQTGLELNLVSNPSGAFLPSSQNATQKRYREVLYKKWGIVFNNAFTFANMPLGRFKDWLVTSGNYDAYMTMLHKAFNPCTIPALMCTNMISVSWDGFLFDCDFNLAANIPRGGTAQHVSTITKFNFKDDPVAVDDHCYACTAGSGFT